MIDEVWSRYGEKYKSFGGWYISGEISRKTKGAIDAFHAMGKQCKDVSGGLPTFISPWIDGKKAVMGTDKLTKEDAVSVQEHEREWNEISMAFMMWLTPVLFRTDISITMNWMLSLR